MSLVESSARSGWSLTFSFCTPAAVDPVRSLGLILLKQGSCPSSTYKIRKAHVWGTVRLRSQLFTSPLRGTINASLRHALAAAGCDENQSCYIALGCYHWPSTYGGLWPARGQAPYTLHLGDWVVAIINIQKSNTQQTSSAVLTQGGAVQRDDGKELQPENAPGQFIDCWSVQLSWQHCSACHRGCAQLGKA